MQLDTPAQTDQPRKEPYVQPKLIVLGTVEKSPSITKIFEEEKARRKTREAEPLKGRS